MEISKSFPADCELKEFFSATEIFLPAPLSARVSIDQFIEKLKKLATVLTLRVNFQIAGACFFYLYDADSDTAFITYIAVLPEFWGKGYAKKLLQQTMEMAIAKNKTRIRLEVARENQRAINFYTRHGFEIVEANGDALIMELRICNEN